MDVAEPHAGQRFKLIADSWYRLKEGGAFLNRHVEHVGDRLILELYVQGLAVVTLALALVARHVDVGQEVHLDADDAAALAGLTASALNVEGKAARRIATHLRFWQPCKPLADGREGANIGRRVGSWCAPDRRLIDVDHLVEVV